MPQTPKIQEKQGILPFRGTWGIGQLSVMHDGQVMERYGGMGAGRRVRARAKNKCTRFIKNAGNYSAHEQRPPAARVAKPLR